ncbi:MAG: DUF952 domain-containing protein [Herpetosiphon sp.]|nr:DUF952 domain-containing protein [Herpetosiphon sp.]
MAYGDEWRAAQARGEYTTASLANEGFIHCSTIQQVLIPANARFRGKADLVLLCLDAAKIHAPIIFEDLYQSGIEFPHIYGTINLDAIVAVLDFIPQADGMYVLPDHLNHMASAGRLLNPEE